MVFEVAPARLLVVASGLPLILLGLFLLLLRPGQRATRFFGAFALLWGVQTMLISLSDLARTAALHDLLLRLGIVLTVVAPLFLLRFLALHPRRDPRLSGRLWTTLMLLVPLPALFFVVLRPDVLFLTLDFGSGPAGVYQWPAVLLVFTPFFGALFVTFVHQALVARHAAGATERARARMIAMALGLFVGYESAQNFLLFAWPLGHGSAHTGPVQIATALLFVVGLALLFAVLVLILMRPPRHLDRDLAFAAALAVPIAVALAERLLAPLGPALDTGWLWRAAAVAFVAYAAARYHLFDLDVRYRTAVVAAVPVAVGTLTLAALAASLAPPVSATAVVAVFAVGTAANVAAWTFRDRLAARILMVGGDDADYLRHRRHEVYRAAMQQLLDEGAPDWDDPRVLTRLARHLGLTPEDHARAAAALRRTAAPAPPPAASSGVLLDGRWRLDRDLGAGAHGRVRLAFDEQTGADVVVKTVSTHAFGGRAAALLVREARALAQLSHPHIVRLVGVVEEEAQVSLVMEYVAGGDLARRLHQRAPLPLDEAVRLLRAILDGLAAAHARGIVHRDLKPENILLAANDMPKVADFGIATTGGPEATMLADAGPMGTLLHMSPEQIRGGPVDARSDLFAAALLFHVMLTGRHVWRTAGHDDFQLRRQILEQPPHLQVDDHPPWVRAFLERGLAKAPDQRWPDAMQMAAALAPPAAASPPASPAGHLDAAPQ